MPELPEVEVVRLGLAEKLPGRVVHSVSVRKPLVLQTPEEIFTQRLVGQKIKSVKRRGKYLPIYLEEECLLVHLGMTGQLTFWDPEKPNSKGFYRQPETGLERTRQHDVDGHTHLTVWFADGTALHYRDVRQFGKIWLLKMDELSGFSRLSKLGPEPLGPAFTLDRFSAAIRYRKRSIKGLLLDQHVLAGVGNIYADEALFCAGIRPNWMASQLTGKARSRLFRAIPGVLQKGIDLGGTSIKDYIDSDGVRGSNQERLWVYGRTGEPCRVCETKILRIKVAGRSSHYCPQCQRKNPIKPLVDCSEGDT